MYSGNYPKDETNIRIPENYNGTSLFDTLSDVSHKSENTASDSLPPPKDISDTEQVFGYKDRDTDCGGGSDGFLGGILDRFLGKNFKVAIPKFEAEELLILGLAIFLFFSKNGDKECAIMLLILIFIN